MTIKFLLELKLVFYSTRHIMDQILSQWHAREFPLWNCSVTDVHGLWQPRCNTSSTQGTNPINLGRVKVKQEVLEEKSGIGTHEYIAKWVSLFSKQLQGWIKFWLQSCNTRKCEPSCINLGCENLRTNSRPWVPLSTELMLKPNLVHPFTLKKAHLPICITIHVKCWQDFSYGLGVLTKNVRVKTTQNSCWWDICDDKQS